MYKLKLDGGSVFDFSVGGMYRDKKRDSFSMNIPLTLLRE